MFHFFERQRLVKKGLASAKVRRRRTRSEFRCTLETGLGVKAGILTLFCLGLAMLILSGSQPQPVEKLLIALLIFATALTQLWINHPNSFASNSRLTLIFGTMLAHLALIKCILGLAHERRDFSAVWPAHYSLCAGAAGLLRVAGEKPGALRGGVRQSLGVGGLCRR